MQRINRLSRIPAVAFMRSPEKVVPADTLIAEARRLTNESCTMP
jgi:hypothetical protein